MIVAWRIAYLMRLGRTCPDLDATLFFDQDEIRGAYLHAPSGVAWDGISWADVQRQVRRLQARIVKWTSSRAVSSVGAH
jgi:hypothetical protein